MKRHSDITPCKFEVNALVSQKPGEKVYFESVIDFDGVDPRFDDRCHPVIDYVSDWLTYWLTDWPPIVTCRRSSSKGRTGGEGSGGWSKDRRTKVLVSHLIVRDICAARERLWESVERSKKYMRWEMNEISDRKWMEIKNRRNYFTLRIDVS